MEKTPKEAYFKAIDSGKRRPKLELIIQQSARFAYLYAFGVIKGRWPEAEAIIAQDAEYAYCYAKYVIDGRWPEAEPVIAQVVQWAYLYARDVIRGRWLEAEAIIAQDAWYAYLYARDVIQGRWPEAEATIRLDAQWAFCYAENVLKGPWPEAEQIFSNGLGIKESDGERNMEKPQEPMKKFEVKTLHPHTTTVLAASEEEALQFLSLEAGTDVEIKECDLGQLLSPQEILEQNEVVVDWNAVNKLVLTCIECKGNSTRYTARDLVVSSGKLRENDCMVLIHSAMVAKGYKIGFAYDEWFWKG